MHAATNREMRSGKGCLGYTGRMASIAIALPTPCPKCGGKTIATLTRVDGTGRTMRITCYQCGFNDSGGESEKKSQGVSDFFDDLADSASDI